jgi:hypothetical protein
MCPCRITAERQTSYLVATAWSPEACIQKLGSVWTRIDPTSLAGHLEHQHTTISTQLRSSIDVYLSLKEPSSGSETGLPSMDSVT